MSESLYQLSAKWRALLEKDEYTPADMDELESLPDAIEDKCIALCYHIKNLEAELFGVEDAQKRAEERAYKLSRKITALEKYLLDCMELNHIQRIKKCPDFVIKIAKNPANVRIEEIDLPSQYWNSQSVRTVNKKLLRDLLLGGEQIPGASLQYTKRVVIK